MKNSSDSSSEFHIVNLYFHCNQVTICNDCNHRPLEYKKGFFKINLGFPEINK